MSLNDSEDLLMHVNLLTLWQAASGACELRHRWRHCDVVEWRSRQFPALGIPSHTETRNRVPTSPLRL